MSAILYGVGALAVVVGAILIGFGIPVSEFSFGNTLILSGTMAIAGGMIVSGLGAAVSQLQRIAEALAARTPIRSSRPLDMFDAAIGARNAAEPTRLPPFPPKTAPNSRDAHSFEPPMNAEIPEEAPAENESFAAPTLHNPDEPPVMADEASLSPPQQPAAGIARAADSRSEMFEAQWRQAAVPSRPPQTTYFDAMWPSESRGPSKTVRDSAPETMFSMPPRENAMAMPQAPVEPEAPVPSPSSSPMANPAPSPVAILKSGVVDGMGYTLYVDGSIEAQLPNGTLRFGSINDLRDHLEKNA